MMVVVELSRGRGYMKRRSIWSVLEDTRSGDIPLKEYFSKFARLDPKPEWPRRGYAYFCIHSHEKKRVAG